MNVIEQLYEAIPRTYSSESRMFLSTELGEKLLQELPEGAVKDTFAKAMPPVDSSTALFSFRTALGVRVHQAASAPTRYTVVVTAGPNGSASLEPSGGVYDEGTSVIATAEPADGYLFVQWSDGNTENPREIEVQEDISIEASFEPVPTPVYTLNVTSGGNGSVALDPPGGSYEEGTVVTVTATPDSNYLFGGWSDGNNNNPREIEMQGDVSIEAMFEAVPVYTLDIATSGNGSVSLDPPGGSYNAGTSVVVTANPSADWQFDGWSDGNTNNPRTVTVNSNTSFAANFEPVPIPTHSLTVTVSGSGSVTLDPPGGTYDEGTVVQVTATPDSGHEFDGWSDGGNTNPRTVTVTSNTSFTANFEPVPVPTYTLDVTVGEGQGSVSLNPPGGTYDEGTVITVTASPDSGHLFDQWSDGNSDNPRSVTLNSDTAFSAAFYEDQSGVPE